MDIISVLPQLVSGLVTGAGGAGTTLLAFFKEQKKKIQLLEQGMDRFRERLGTDDTEPKTGIYYLIDNLAKQQRKLSNEINSWHEDPPDWLLRVGRRGSVNLELQSDIEQRMEQRLASLTGRMKRIEEAIEEQENARERSSPGVRTFITRAEYEEDSHLRSVEMSRIKDNLSSANTWLRGLLSASGYIDPDTHAHPQPVPPKSMPRKGTDK